MSTLELEHLKHTSSSSNNLSVHSDGSLTLGNLTNLNVNGRFQIGDSSITQAYTAANLGYVMDVQASTGNQTYISIAEPGTSSLGDNGMIIGEDTSDSWIVQRGNKGMNFSTSDLGRLLIDGSGRITTPYQPSFAARLSSNWAHGSGVREIGGTWSTIHNVGGHWDNATRRFTAPIAGTYLFTAIVGTVGGVTGVSYISAEVWVNGARGNHMNGGWDSGGSSYNQNSNAFITQLSAGDYVSLASEINVSCTIQSGSHTQLRGYLLG